MRRGQRSDQRAFRRGFASRRSTSRRFSVPFDAPTMPARSRQEKCALIYERLNRGQDQSGHSATAVAFSLFVGSCASLLQASTGRQDLDNGSKLAWTARRIGSDHQSFRSRRLAVAAGGARRRKILKAPAESRANQLKQRGWSARRSAHKRFRAHSPYQGGFAAAQNVVRICAGAFRKARRNLPRPSRRYNSTCRR
jgi:hypothetical protein